MADTNTRKTPDLMAVLDVRRSTRIARPVPLSVSGQNKFGQWFSELTSTVAVNCHGCVYPSRYAYKPGSWVTLEVPNTRAAGKTHPMRAQVRFMRLPRSAHELYQVGVELETPANVWGIESPPEDWYRFPISISAGAGAARAVVPMPERRVSSRTEEEIRVLPDSTADGSSRPVPPLTGASTPQASSDPSDPPKLEWMLSSSDPLLRGLVEKLEQVAEKAVGTVLGTAVSQAVSAIDNFSQTSMRQIEERCVKYREDLVTSARQELLGRLQVDIAHAQEHLRKQLEIPLAEAQEARQRLEKSAAADFHLVLTEAVSRLKETARKLHDQFSVRVSQTTDRAAAELGAETVRLSDQQLAQLAKDAQGATGEAATRLEARAAEARAQLESAAGTALGEFHQRAEIEIDQVAGKVRQNLESSLTSFAAEIRADWEARQRACQDQLARSSEQAGEQFRQRLEAILNSSMVAAMSAVNEHSRAMLDSLSKDEPNKNAVRFRLVEVKARGQ